MAAGLPSANLSNSVTSHHLSPPQFFIRMSETAGISFKFLFSASFFKNPARSDGVKSNSSFITELSFKILNSLGRNFSAEITRVKFLEFNANFKTSTNSFESASAASSKIPNLKLSKSDWAAANSFRRASSPSSDKVKRSAVNAECFSLNFSAYHFSFSCRR